MRERIILLTDCGAEIGFGHVSRCVALAQAFREAGQETELWIAADETTRPHLPAGARAIIWYELPGDVDVELARAAAVLVDSYVVTLPQIDRIATVNPAIAVIDDWRRLGYSQGVVIDWTVGAEKFAYREKSPGAHYLLGSRFTALRPEFHAPGERRFPAEPQAVLVTFGGADVRHLTRPVLTLLRGQFPALQVHVIVGAGVRDRAFVETRRDERTTFHQNCTAAKMRTLMERADFAICAGGQTLYELAAQGLPPVVVQVAENQTDDLREFGAGGFALLAGDWNSADLPAKIAAGVRSLWPPAERRRRSAIGRRCVDGCGARRLVQACLEQWSAPPVLLP